MYFGKSLLVPLDNGYSPGNTPVAVLTLLWAALFRVYEFIIARMSLNFIIIIFITIILIYNFITLRLCEHWTPLTSGVEAPASSPADFCNNKSCTHRIFDTFACLVYSSEKNKRMKSLHSNSFFVLYDFDFIIYKNIPVLE